MSIPVLFFSANPVDMRQLDLDDEYRVIDEEHARARQREGFDLRLAPAVRVEDISHKLLQYRPEVVHFGGHGQYGEGRSGGLLVKGDDGYAVPVSIDTLAEMFQLQRGRVRCVVLNACHTLALAQALSAYVPYVVGTKRAIRDRSAIAFAQAFYSFVFDGMSFAEAFAAGRNAVRIGSVDDADAYALRCQRGAPAPRPGPAPPSRAPFLVPFSRNEAFVGRDADLEELHARLRDAEPGAWPVALTGMGGIGKTQLAVEYAHRYREDYPGGVYWVNAAAPWQAELAMLAERVGIVEDAAPENRRERLLAWALVRRFEEHPGALVIFDNVDDPLALRDARADLVPVTFAARLLFTTRRRERSAPFDLVDVPLLSEAAALSLLLSRRGREDHTPAELDIARSICASLGYLPLALMLAAAYLEKLRDSFAGYLSRLHREGALPVTDSQHLDLRKVATLHEAAVGATLWAQWNALLDENARLALRVAAILGEAALVSRPRLSLLSGLADHVTEDYLVPLDDALHELDGLSLLEELTSSTFQLHPLVREFAEARIEPLEPFQAACAARLARALEDMRRLHEQVEARGAYAVLADLRVGLAMAGNGVWARLDGLFRPLAREAHALGRWDSARQPGYFLQQLRNRSADLGLEEMTRRIEEELACRGWPFLRERLRTGCESEALVRTLEGHAHRVTGVAVTPDGQWVVSASLDDTLKVWDLATGVELHTLRGHTGHVNGVAVTPDSRLAVSASKDGTLKVWDLATGRELRSLIGHGDSVVGAVVTPDGQWVVSASLDGTLKVWDLAAGRELRSLVGHGDGVNAVAVTPDSRFAISASSDGTLMSWDLVTGRSRVTLGRGGQSAGVLTREAPTVSGVAVTPDGRFAVSVSSRQFQESTIELWDLGTGEPRAINAHQTINGSGPPVAVGHGQLRASWGTVRGMVVTLDRRILCASSDATLKIWDLEGSQATHVLKGHADEVSGVAVTRDGLVAVTASHDHTLKVWDLARGPDSHAGDCHVGSVNRVAASSDGRRAVTASDDGTLKVWDLATGHVLRTLAGHTARVNGVALTPDGRLAVSASDDETLNVWDLGTGAVVCTFASHNEEVKDVAVTPDGRLAISASRDDTLQVWELATGRKIRTLRGHNYRVQGVAVTADGRLAVSASADPALKVWDLATGAEVRTLESHTGDVTCVAVTPDGRFVVSATSSGRTLTVWDLATGQQVRVLEGHEARVNGVAVTPDSRFAVSTASDSTLRLWDLATGELGLTLAAHAPLACCAVTPDGRTFLVGDALGGMHILDWIDPARR